MIKNDVAHALMRKLGVEEHQVFTIKMTTDLAVGPDFYVFKDGQLYVNNKHVKVLHRVHLILNAIENRGVQVQNLTPHEYIVESIIRNHYIKMYKCEEYQDYVNWIKANDLEHLEFDKLCEMQNLNYQNLHALRNEMCALVLNQPLTAIDNKVLSEMYIQRYLISAAQVKISIYENIIKCYGKDIGNER